MIKLQRNNAGKNICHMALALCLSGLLACSSPEEQAAKYYEKGLALLEQGDLIKARIELQNALQIRPSMSTAWYALAQIAEQQGDWEKLFSLLNKVIDHDPKHLAAQIKLGRLQLAVGQLDKALATSDIALKLAPDSADALGLRAGVLYKLEDQQGALTQANAALAVSPHNIDALVVLATERLAAGDAKSAITYLDRGLTANEKNIALQLIKVQALESLAQTDSAEAIFRRLIALYPEARALRHALAQFYLQHQRPDAAEAEYRTIAADHPRDVQARLDVARFIGSTRGQRDEQAYLQEQIAIEPGNHEFTFALAALHQAAGDQSAAEGVYRDIIARTGATPEAIKAKGLLAGILLANGNKAEAQRLLNEVLAGDQRNEQGLLLKAGLAIEAQQLDQAIADLRTILRDSPNSPRALLLLAKAHEMAGAVELAQESYQKAYEVGKPNASFAIAYAEFLLQRGQAARAELVASEILQHAPDHVPALKLLAQARINQGNWAGAQAVADGMLKHDDQSQAADQVRGALYAARKDYSESIAAFRRAHDAAPADIQPIVALVRSYMLANKPDEAITFLQSASQASPNNPTTQLLLGELYAAKGNIAQAEKHFQQLLQLQPEQATGYVKLAGLYVRNGNLAEAERTISQGLGKIPGHVELLTVQASLFELGKRYEDAIQAYEVLLRQHPDSDIVTNNLASLLSEQRQDQASLTRAYELAQRFRRSEVAYFKDTLGWASYRVGKIAEAAKLLEEVVAQAPDQAIFRYHLGMSYLALHNKEQARKELQSVLALSQGNNSADAERAQAALNTL